MTEEEETTEFMGEFSMNGEQVVVKVPVEGSEWLLEALQRAGCLFTDIEVREDGMEASIVSIPLRTRL